ncbi:MAG TPA: OmpA family protein [Alcanivoracaceae bacterium]|nr:OmpA family protein [Alcanivoracaceae bacterium]
MRKQFFSACLIASSALVLSTAASAAGTNIERGAYIGGQASYSWFENDVTLNPDHKEWYGGQIGLRYHPNFSIEASYTEGKFEDKQNANQGKHILNRMPLISNRFHFNGGVLGFEPYVGLAAGEFWAKSSQVDGVRHRETVVAPEFGVQRRFLNRLLLDVGARAPYSIDYDNWQGQAYAGLNFLFAVKDRHTAVVEEPVEEYVAPVEPTTQIVQRDVNESGTAAQFEFDDASLSADQLDDLRAAARFLNANPNTSITLEGHTCNMGPEEYNQALSERRAENAKQFLVEQGVDASRITTIGKGESEPVADNSTREGRERNRRVDAVITGTVEEEVTK